MYWVKSFSLQRSCRERRSLVAAGHPPTTETLFYSVLFSLPAATPASLSFWSFFLSGKWLPFGADEKKKNEVLPSSLSFCCKSEKGEKMPGANGCTEDICSPFLAWDLMGVRNQLGVFPSWFMASLRSGSSVNISYLLNWLLEYRTQGIVGLW